MPLGQLGKSALRRKDADRDRTNVMIDYKNMSDFFKSVIVRRLILTLTLIYTSCEAQR